MNQYMHISPWRILQFMPSMSCQLRHASPWKLPTFSSDFYAIGQDKRMTKWNKLSMNMFPACFCNGNKSTSCFKTCWSEVMCLSGETGKAVASKEIWESAMREWFSLDRPGFSHHQIFLGLEINLLNRVWTSLCKNVIQSSAATWECWLHGSYK